MNIKNQKDFSTGVMFMVVGLAFAWGATNYRIGIAARMGPGYFPLMLGILLAILGAVITFKSMVIKTENDQKIGAWALKPVFFIIAANMVFGALMVGLPSIKLPAMGMIIGIYGLTFIASLARDNFKFTEVLILATLLAVISYLAFIVLLKLNYLVWPSFVSR